MTAYLGRSLPFCLVYPNPFNNMKLKSLKIWMPATVICLAAACLTTACRSIQHLSDKHQKETVMNIPYVVMNNYFLKNNVVGISYPLITKQEEFSGLFGMAAVMGKTVPRRPLISQRNRSLPSYCPKQTFQRKSSLYAWKRAPHRA